MPEDFNPPRNQLDQYNDSIAVLTDAAFGMREEGSPIIHGLNLDVHRSSLTVIIGGVGSGKSTILKGLIGELPSCAGSMQSIFSEAAYCEQQPWLVNTSIRSNILGYSALEAKWYETVIKSCALDSDFAMLPLGDMTSVGSKGISISGGQKSRIVRLTSNALYFS
jgi:ATP-binding cassette subfamily C (CFTR/MRP) protein 1